MNTELLKNQAKAALEQSRKELASNTRLRIGVAVIAFIVALQPIWYLKDERERLRGSLVTALEREAKVLRTANEAVWVKRAEEARKMNSELRGRLGAAKSPGEAEALLQQRLQQWFEDARLQNASINLDDPSEIEGFPGYYRVVASVDSRFEAGKLYRVLDLFRKGQPPVVVERLDVDQQRYPRMKLQVAGYFVIGESNIDEAVVGEALNGDPFTPEPGDASAAD